MCAASRQTQSHDVSWNTTMDTVSTVIRLERMTFDTDFSKHVWKVGKKNHINCCIWCWWSFIVTVWYCIVKSLSETVLVCEHIWSMINVFQRLMMYVAIQVYTESGISGMCGCQLAGNSFVPFSSTYLHIFKDWNACFKDALISL